MFMDKLSPESYNVSIQKASVILEISYAAYCWKDN